MRRISYSNSHTAWKHFPHVIGRKSLRSCRVVEGNEINPFAYPRPNISQAHFLALWSRAPSSHVMIGECMISIDRFSKTLSSFLTPPWLFCAAFSFSLYSCFSFLASWDTAPASPTILVFWISPPAPTSSYQLFSKWRNKRCSIGDV